MEKRTVYIWALSVITFVVLMLITPAIPQSEEYHNFADQREFFGTLSLSLSPHSTSAPVTSESFELELIS